MVTCEAQRSYAGWTKDIDTAKAALTLWPLTWTLKRRGGGGRGSQEGATGCVFAYSLNALWMCGHGGHCCWTLYPWWT